MTRSVSEKRMSLFERYLSLWVGICMLVGISIGKLLPAAIDSLRRMEFGSDSQIQSTHFVHSRSRSLCFNGSTPPSERNQRIVELLF